MNVTKQAQEELLKALKKFDKPGAGIHIFNGPGCCGPAVQMDLAEHAGNDETVIEKDGIDFFVANELLPEAADIIIGFGEKGFTLTGLKKSGGCCG